MRTVVVSDTVQEKIENLRNYLLNELKLSREAAKARTYRMDVFLLSLGYPADYPLCRFKKWQQRHIWLTCPPLCRKVESV